MKKVLLCLSFLFLLFPSTVSAIIGVGVGTGKIQVDEDLKPGIIYELPSLSVLNTGDEPSEYQVSVTYHEKQPELSPPESWFIFTPHEFHLEPGQAQIVDVKLNLPLQIEPGDYFAYLEAHPLKKAQTGGNTSIGIAAASKLYFTVTPANIWSAIYYKAISFWNVYAPWPQRVAIGLGIIVVLLIIKKFFNFEVGLKKKPAKSNDPGAGSEAQRKKNE